MTPAFLFFLGLGMALLPIIFLVTSTTIGEWMGIPVHEGYGVDHYVLRYINLGQILHRIYMMGLILMLMIIPMALGVTLCIISFVWYFIQSVLH